MTLIYLSDILDAYEENVAYGDYTDKEDYYA